MPRVRLTADPERLLGARPLWADDAEVPEARAHLHDAVRAGALEALLLREHGEDWSRYLATGEIEGMAELLAEADDDDDAPRPGPWDGLLASTPDNDAPIAAEPGEEEDPDESYDALPGFEAYG